LQTYRQLVNRGKLRGTNHALLGRERTCVLAFGWDLLRGYILSRQPLPARTCVLKGSCSDRPNLPGGVFTKVASIKTRKTKLAAP